MQNLYSYIGPALFAFVLCLGLTRAALWLFPKIGLLDRPHKYGLKRNPIPYYGGLTLVSAFFLSVLLFVRLDAHLIGLLIGASMIVVVSFLDDRFGLSPYLRLGVQILAALCLVLAGIGIASFSNPFGPPIVLDQFQFQLKIADFVLPISLLSALFTIIWIVALTNTMNFLDGLNGLPSGVTAIGALTLFFLSIRPDLHFDISSQIPVATMSIILFACCLAFWFFDFYPAKILMGDTGSMFLGYILAALAIFSGGKVATAFLVLGFPILDAGWVIARRIWQGKSPFKGDLKHLHHRLLEAGLTERRALLMIYVFCALFGCIAVLLQGKEKAYAIGGLLLVMLAVALWVIRKPYRNS